MPCYDERNSPSYVREETKRQLMESFTHNSHVAEMLCEATMIIREAKLEDKLSQDVRNWMMVHQLRDAEMMAQKGGFPK